jgi:hypothetical protein
VRGLSLAHNNIGAIGINAMALTLMVPLSSSVQKSIPIEWPQLVPNIKFALILGYVSLLNSAGTQASPVLTSLLLAGNRLGPAGATQLGRALKVYKIVDSVLFF